jgi:hypothetical protein
MTTNRVLLTLVIATILFPWQALAALSDPPASRRTMQVVLSVAGDDVRVSALRLLPEGERQQRGRRIPGDLVFALETEDGERIASATADDPTRLRAEWTPDGKTIARSDVRLDRGEVALKFPYDQRAVKLRVSRPLTGDVVRAKDTVWGVALRDVCVLDLGGLPSPVQYAKIADFATRPIALTGPSENRLDVVFLGDGYRESDLGKYHDDVRAVVDYMLSVEPYTDFRSMMNFYAVDVISNESGIDDPSTGTRRDTALDLSFNIGGTQRCVYTNSPAKVYAAAANVANYDYIFVVANDAQYGGCGGSFACFTTHSAATEIAVHEFGHSFGLLADEYGSGDGGGTPPLFEPDRVNATLATTRQALVAAGKWDYWVPDGTRIPTLPGTPGVGVFEGAVYSDTGAYRPQDNCRMRELFQDFCKICVEQHILRFHAFADPIDVFSPAPTDVIGGGRVLAMATDPAGDAPGSADVLGVTLVQLADALSFTIELGAVPPAASNGLGGYKIALTSPGQPLRYIRIGLNRTASFTNDQFDEIAPLGGAYVVGTKVESRVPLSLLGDPTSLTWSLTSTTALSTDTVPGTTVSVTRIGNAVLPLSTSESVTLQAGLLPVTGASYSTQWFVDGAARAEGTSLTLVGADLAAGRHTVALEVVGTSTSIRRDLDGILHSRREIVVVVGPTTGRPTALAGADVRASRGASVTLDGSASVGSALAFTWRQIAGPRVGLDDQHASKPVFDAPDRNVLLAFQLVVGAGDMLSLPDIVYVAVGAVPVVSNVTVKNNKKLLITGSGFGSGAVIEIDGVAVADTKAAAARPDSKLSSRSALALAPSGRTVMITVRNQDGARGAPFAYTR